MKELFKKFTSILMVIVTLLDMFLGPICVLASEVDAKAGDLRLGTEYKSEIGESVSATEGSFKSEGDVEIRKTVTKLDNNGKYEVKFEARGKDTSKTTYNEAPIYAVIVFDRSNSMTNKTGKWDNAKSAARAFAEGLIEKYAKANIAVVTFGTTAKTTQGFINSNLKSTSDDTLFGYAPTNRWDENGATNLHAGLEKAKTLLSSDKIKKDAKKYVIVISDGAPTKYGVIGDGGNGSNTGYYCIDYPVNTAKALKDSGVEIFTVGYDLSNEIIYEGGWWDSYRNSTAASILKLIATDSSHYVSSDKDNIVDKLKGIVSSTTVYSPAAKNLVIVDNIGKAFSSESDTDKDGKITLTLDKTTGEWQEVGKFEIQIDKNSTTGWHNTNDNFTYTWDGLGETKESTKNPEVYWVQPEYSYVIKHVEKDNKDNVLLTENSKANYGTNVEVKEKSFTGFTYDSKDRDFIEIDEDNNIAYVYYTRNSYSYTIKHVELGNESNVLGTETESAEYKDIIEVKSKNFKGYTYNSKDKNSIVIDTDNNTATVYYTRNNYNYIIKHVEKDNENNVLDTETEKADFGDAIEVKSKEFKGFTYASQDKETIVIDTENNTATVYYTRNNYNYTIKHVEKDTNKLLAQDTNSANYEEVIAVEPKEFTGFTYDSKDKDTIIIDTENNIATVFYTRNNYEYIIRHIEKNTDNILDIEMDSAKYEDIIKVNEKEFTGFTYDSKDKETIIISTEDNIANIYYTRNSYDYSIVHLEKDTNNVLGIETDTANYEDVINVNEKEFTGFTYDSKSSETITINEDKNIAYVYYTRNTYSYKVEHYVEKVDGTFELRDTDEINDVLYESKITYNVKDYKNYIYDESKTINPEYVLNGNEVVKLYYVLGESEVIVHYVVKVDDNYIPFAKAAYDANGKLISNFEGVTLTDAKFVGKIGSEFKTELRYVYEYAFNGIYEGNILINTNIPKLDGETITSTIDFETKEYTYVYESPKGGDVPVPPDTGINNFSYANYLLLLVIAYLLKKYTTKEN